MVQARQSLIDQGDAGRFTELMARTYKKVFNLAYRLSGDRTDAADLAQEAFFRAYRGFGQFEGDRPFENWVFRIVTRLYLDLKRTRNRRVKTVSYDAPLNADGSDDPVYFESSDPKASPEDAFVSRFVSEDLEWSLDRLTREQRELVWMADVEGVPYREIAEKINAPVGTVRSRLHRAHKQLRALMECYRNDCRCGKACPSH